jgi:hypothetical protein
MNSPNFFNYLMQDHMSTHNDSAKANFVTQCGLVIMDVDVETFQSELKIFRENKFPEIQKLLKNSSPWFTSLLHECLHCYHLLGTTTGWAEYFFSTKQNELISTCISQFKEAVKEDIRKSNDHYNEIRRNCNSFTIARYIFQLRPLFGSSIDVNVTRNKYHIPKVGDFFTPLTYGLHHFRHLSRFKKINFSKIIDEFSLESAKSMRQPVDFALKGDIFSNIYKNSYNFVVRDNALYLSTKSIIEGYARLQEGYLFGYAVMDSTTSYDTFSDLLKELSREQASNYLTEFVKRLRIGIEVKEQGIYKDAIVILKHALGFILKKKDINEYYQTCFAVFELTLMTRFTPNTVFKKDPSPLNLNELLIPYRFIAVLKYFLDNDRSISDVGNAKSTDIDRLDIICEALGWVKYSYLLTEIEELYLNGSVGNKFVNKLGSEVIKKKKNNLFPKRDDICFEFLFSLMDLPLCVAFKREKNNSGTSLNTPAVTDPNIIYIVSDIMENLGKSSVGNLLMIPPDNLEKATKPSFITKMIYNVTRAWMEQDKMRGYPWSGPPSGPPPNYHWVVLPGNLF